MVAAQLRIGRSGKIVIVPTPFGELPCARKRDRCVPLERVVGLESQCEAGQRASVELSSKITDTGANGIKNESVELKNVGATVPMASRRLSLTLRMGAMMCRRMSFRRQWMSVERRMEEVQDGRGVGERADVRMAWASRDDEGNGTESPTLYSTCGWAAVQNESRCSARFRRVECGRSVLLICKQKAQAS